MSGSARRAAPAAASPAFTPEQEAELSAWTKAYPHPHMGLVEALRQVQEWHRRVSPEAAARVAELFGLPAGRVWEVATFFPAFTRRETVRRRVGLCRGLSCWLAGAEAAAGAAREVFGVAERERTPDGAFSWEAMECLGACDHAPAFQVDDRLAGRCTREALERVKKEDPRG